MLVNDEYKQQQQHYIERCFSLTLQGILNYACIRNHSTVTSVTQISLHYNTPQG